MSLQDCMPARRFMEQEPRESANPQPRMKHPSFHLPALFVATALLCSCEFASVVPRSVPFDETAFVPYRASGSGVVAGRVAGVFDDKQARVAQHAAVRLMPDNAYTEEIERKTFRQTESLAPPDPRFSRYVREVKTDGNGNFAFDHLPPGNYYVTCRFTWPYHTIDHTVDPSVESDNIAEQTLYAKVSVGRGQSVRVQSWSISEWFALPVSTPS